MTRGFAITLNALSLYVVAAVLAAAFAAQLQLHEPPCPLCQLQRLQFTILAIGPILNIRFGPRPSHYALALLAAIAGAAFSARQILLLLVPGNSGSTLNSSVYFTGGLIGFAAAIVLLAAMLLFDRQFESYGTARPVAAGVFARFAVWLVIGLTALNVGATLLQNPVVDQLLKR
jgi:disulfide bond formation protein DsbB